MDAADVATAMADEGCDGGIIAAVLRRLKKRSAGADRQARYRERKAALTVTSDVTSDVTNRNESVTSDALPRAPIHAPVLNLEEIVDIPSQIATLSSAPESKKRATRLPESWSPSEANRSEAQRLGLTDEQCDAIAEEFRNYWLSEAGQRSRKLDWDRTFLNRLRDQAPRYRTRSMTGQTAPTSNPEKSVHAAARKLCEDVASGRVTIGPVPPSIGELLARDREREREDRTRMLSQG
jgi:hypothetical protein